MLRHRTAVASFVVLISAGLTAASATASTITLQSTHAAALADIQNVPVTGPLVAADAYSLNGHIGQAVADVGAGHLGAFAESPDHASQEAVSSISLVLGIADVPTMTFRFVMDAAFTQGATATFSLVESSTLGGLFGISCGPTIVGYCVGGDNFTAVNGLPLTFNAVVNTTEVDVLYLDFVLNASAMHNGTVANPAIADIVNSVDFSILLPSDTVVVNNPAGRLFQIEGQTDPTAVPEPATLSLMLVPAITLVRRQRRLFRRSSLRS